MKIRFIHIPFFLLSIIYIYEFLKYAFSPLILNYETADLLINYKNGFIRRGLLGSIFLQFNKVGINPLLIVRLFSISCFTAICLIFYHYFKKNKLSTNFLLLPFFLPYLLLCNMIGFRDYFLILIIYTSIYLLNKRGIIHNIICSILLIIGVLSHEMFILYSCSTLLIYSLLKGRNYLLKSMTLSVPAIIAFFFVTEYSGGIDGLATEMLSSIQYNIPQNKPILQIPNSLLALEGTLTNHIGYVFKLNNLGFSRGLVYVSFIGFLFALLFNFKLFKKSNGIFILPFIFISSIFMTLPIYYAAIDWQRFIYLSFLLTFIVFFFISSDNFTVNNVLINKWSNIVTKKLSFISIHNRNTLYLLCLLFPIPYINLGNHPYLFSNVLLIIYSYISKIILQ
ncbi:hypothetical protein [Chryseobacterium sp. T1]